MHGKLVPHYQMYFAGNGMDGGKLGLKGPTLPVARIENAIARVQLAHLASGYANFFTWARAQQPEYFINLLADLAEVKAEELQSVMQDYGDENDFRVLQLGGGECAGATQVLIGANFFEAAHEREYRNALVFQRKYFEAAQCNEAILRLLGSGLAQLLCGKREDDLQQLALQLRRLVSGPIADEFVSLVAVLTNSDEITVEEITSVNAAVDSWTVKVATYATEVDAQLDLTESSLLI